MFDLPCRALAVIFSYLGNVSSTAFGVQFLISVSVVPKKWSFVLKEKWFLNKSKKCTLFSGKTCFMKLCGYQGSHRQRKIWGNDASLFQTGNFTVLSKYFEPAKVQKIWIWTLILLRALRRCLKIMSIKTSFFAYLVKSGRNYQNLEKYWNIVGEKKREHWSMKKYIHEICFLDNMPVMEVNNVIVFTHTFNNWSRHLYFKLVNYISAVIIF